MAWARCGKTESGRNGGLRSVSPIKWRAGVWAKSGDEGLFAHKVEGVGSVREG